MREGEIWKEWAATSEEIVKAHAEREDYGKERDFVCAHTLQERSFFFLLGFSQYCTPVSLIISTFNR